MPKKKVTKKAVRVTQTPSKAKVTAANADTQQRQMLLVAGIAVVLVLGMYILQQAMGRSLFTGADASAQKCSNNSAEQCKGKKVGKRIVVGGGAGTYCVKRGTKATYNELNGRWLVDCAKQKYNYGETAPAESRNEFCAVDPQDPCNNRPVHAKLALASETVYANCWAAQDVAPGGSGKKSSITCELGDRYTDPDAAPEPPQTSGDNGNKNTGGAKDFCNVNSDDYNKDKCKNQGGDTGSKKEKDFCTKKNADGSDNDNYNKKKCEAQEDGK